MLIAMYKYTKLLDEIDRLQEVNFNNVKLIKELNKYVEIVKELEMWIYNERISHITNYNYCSSYYNNRYGVNKEYTKAQTLKAVSEKLNELKESKTKNK